MREIDAPEMSNQQKFQRDSCLLIFLKWKEYVASKMRCGRRTASAPVYNAGRGVGFVVSEQRNRFNCLELSPIELDSQWPQSA
jgi:hypothetical protein